jgi:hypothetical protein
MLKYIPYVSYGDVSPRANVVRIFIFYAFLSKYRQKTRSL